MPASPAKVVEVDKAGVAGAVAAVVAPAVAGAVAAVVVRKYVALTAAKVAPAMGAIPPALALSQTRLVVSVADAQQAHTAMGTVG